MILYKYVVYFVMINIDRKKKLTKTYAHEPMGTHWAQGGHGALGNHGAHGPSNVRMGRMGSMGPV